MAKAKKLPSGSWRVLAYVGKSEDGKRQYKSFVADSKKEAEYQAAEYVYKRKQENKSENLTFQQASDQYIESKSNILSPSTIWGYRIMQRNAFPSLLNEKIGELAVNDKIQKQMNVNAKRYSAKSLHNQYGFISAVMKHFRYALPPTALKPLENKSIAVPTEKEVEKILGLLKGTDVECEALLALTCSLRQSEIAALTSDDINGQIITVHGAKVPEESGKLIYKETNKTAASARTVSMPPYLAKLMAEACDKAKTENREWLFTSRPSTVLRRLKKLLTQNGIPPYTMHALRHAFAAVMHAQGVPDKYVMAMGGWASDHVMKRIYQYAFVDKTQQIKQEANKYFEKSMQHEMQHKRKEYRVHAALSLKN